MKLVTAFRFLVLAAVASIAGALSVQAQTVTTIIDDQPGPTSVAVDANGTLSFAYAFGVESFSNGELALIDYDNDEQIRPDVFVIDASGDVIFFDRRTGSIKELVAAGGYVSIKTINSTVEPGAIAIDAQGNIFVTSGPGAVLELVAASGYVTVKNLGGGFTSPSGIALDAESNVFVTDASAGTVTEILAEGGYATTKTLAGGFGSPSGIAIDGSGNLFVASVSDSGVVEILAAGGYTTTKPLASGTLAANGIAIDGSGNLFIVDVFGVKEVLAEGGYTTVKTLIARLDNPFQIGLDPSGNVYVSFNEGMDKIAAAGGYTAITPIAGLVASPLGVAVDRNENFFVSDFDPTGSTPAAMKLLPASDNYAVVKFLPDEFAAPHGVAVDGSGNVFVADSGNDAVKEILATGGYVTVTTLGSGFSQPQGVAVDNSGDIFVADTGNNAIKEIVAVDGAIPASPVIRTLGSGFSAPASVAVDILGNVYVADTGNSAIKEIPAAGGYATVKTLGSGFNQPQGIAVDLSGNIFIADTKNNAIKEISAPSTVLEASVLPSSRSVEIGSPATAYATMINTGDSALDNCRILPAPLAPDGLSLSYQTTDASTNALTGTPNTPVTIAGKNGLQSFLISLSNATAFSAPGLSLGFICDNVTPAAALPGVDTIDLTVSDTPIADIIALAATPSGGGILDIPAGGIAAFSVASTNVGATAAISVSLDTGAATLPVTATICQSDPANGQCLTPPAASVSLNYAGGAAPTFSVFVQSAYAFPFAPGTSRLFVRFKDAEGGLHGSTSVALESDSN